MQSCCHRGERKPLWATDYIFKYDIPRTPRERDSLLEDLQPGLLLLLGKPARRHLRPPMLHVLVSLNKQVMTSTF